MGVGLVGGLEGVVAGLVVVGLEGETGDGDVDGLVGVVDAPAGVTISFRSFDEFEYGKLPLGSLNSAPMS